MFVLCFTHIFKDFDCFLICEFTSNKESQTKEDAFPTVVHVV